MSRRPLPARAVLFDLDDTLFDHRGTSRRALTVLRARWPVLVTRSLDELERVHCGILEDLHEKVLRGELPLELARVERFRRLLQHLGATRADGLPSDLAAGYREAYLASRALVPGARPLLAYLHRQAQVAIVSNNVLDEQERKLEDLALRDFVDAVIVSEDVGTAKPDAAIFHRALERVRCAAAEAVMVGDSWASDVVGAHNAGVRPVWFNRKHEPSPDATVDELRSLEPTEWAAMVILQGRRENGQGA